MNVVPDQVSSISEEFEKSMVLNNNATAGPPKLYRQNALERAYAPPPLYRTNAFETNNWRAHEQTIILPTHSAGGPPKLYRQNGLERG